MERVPEPELMDDPEQALAYADADFEEPHRRFIELLRRAFPALSETGCALDLGCGPGDISVRFARAWPGWRVDGVDGAPAMLRRGWDRVEREGLADRVHLREARLPVGTPPHRDYDLILSNSLLHHLRDPAVLWAAVREYAADGAPVFVMDLLRPGTPEEALRLVEEHCAGEPEILRRDFLHSLHAAYRPAEVRDQLRVAGLGHLGVRVVSDRHLLVEGRR